MIKRWTIQELAERVNDWCEERGVRPANGQAASDLSARTLRFYRSSGLLDAAESGVGRGYGQRHFLQLAAIRILQAQGLPLSRIQQLLFGRSDEELEQIAQSARKVASGAVDLRHQPFSSHETWTTYPLDERLFLVARDRRVLSTSQIEAIRKICGARPKQNSRTR
jgi:DNA-binding transcriptional MerR regulator